MRGEVLSDSPRRLPVALPVLSSQLLPAGEGSKKQLAAPGREGSKKAASCS